MEFLSRIIGFVNDTQVPDQIREVDVVGLFTNPWFLVPFLAFVGWKLYKMSINTLVVTAVAIGLWAFSGSPMMQGLIVNGELQLDKVLPVVGVGIVAIGIVIYFLFIRSD